MLNFFEAGRCHMAVLMSNTPLPERDGSAGYRSLNSAVIHKSEARLVQDSKPLPPQRRPTKTSLKAGDHSMSTAAMLAAAEAEGSKPAVMASAWSVVNQPTEGQMTWPSSQTEGSPAVPKPTGLITIE